MGYSSVTMPMSAPMRRQLSAYTVTESSDFGAFNRPVKSILADCPFVEICDNGRFVARSHSDFYTLEKKG